MPAKQDGPISTHSRPMTTAAWRGPIHKKCRKIVTCYVKKLSHDQQLDKTFWAITKIYICSKEFSPNIRFWTVFTDRIKPLDGYLPRL